MFNLVQVFFLDDAQRFAATRRWRFRSTSLSTKQESRKEFGT